MKSCTYAQYVLGPRFSAYVFIIFDILSVFDTQLMHSLIREPCQKDD